MTNVAELYRDHRGWLIAWLHVRLGCGETAADLAHDTFLKLLGKAEPLAVREPKAFLRTVAHGLVVDFIRRREIERAYQDALLELDGLVVPSEEERAIVVETLVRIEATLAGLPIRTKTAFLLSRLEGLNHRAIAAQLGVSLSTIDKDMALATRHCYRVRYGH